MHIYAFASNVRIGSDPILCVGICVTIDAILNFSDDFDVDANADVTCEQDNATEAIDSGVLRGEGSHEPLPERLNYNVVITQLYVCITKL